MCNAVKKCMDTYYYLFSPLKFGVQFGKQSNRVIPFLSIRNKGASRAAPKKSQKYRIGNWHGLKVETGKKMVK